MLNQTKFKGQMTKSPKKVNAKYQAEPELIIEKGGILVINTNKQPLFGGEGKIFVHKVTKIDHRLDDVIDYAHIEKYGPMEYEVEIIAKTTITVDMYDAGIGLCKITIKPVYEKEN